MLKIKIYKKELFDDDKGMFVESNEVILRMEHSLYAISEWESVFKKPFLDDSQKTDEEMLYYIKCMCLDEVSNDTLNSIGIEEQQLIANYISDSRTATTISNHNKKKSSNEKITSELIYYWMTALNIPFECQYWHINRLLTLVQICNIKNEPPNNMSTADVIRSNQQLNAARRKKLGTKG